MIAEPLRRFLDERHVRYAVRPHAARADAAKTVLVLALTHPPGQLVLVAVPEQAEVDLPRLHALLGFPVELAPESRWACVFPGWVPGFVPPIGEIAVQHIPLYVDASLNRGETIAFSGGTDTELVEMPWSEYRRVAAHTLVDCCRPRDPKALRPGRSLTQ